MDERKYLGFTLKRSGARRLCTAVIYHLPTFSRLLSRIILTYRLMCNIIHYYFSIIYDTNTTGFFMLQFSRDSERSFIYGRPSKKRLPK